MTAFLYQLCFESILRSIQTQGVEIHIQPVECFSFYCYIASGNPVDRNNRPPNQRQSFHLPPQTGISNHLNPLRYNHQDSTTASSAGRNHRNSLPTDNSRTIHQHQNGIKTFNKMRVEQIDQTGIQSTCLHDFYRQRRNINSHRLFSHLL